MNIAQGGSLGGSSFVHESSKRSFDVRKEADVIELLRFIHVNALDPEIKNHLRDLIFTYRQSLSPDDAKLVAQSFIPLGIEVVYSDALKEEHSTASSASKGFMRPMPRFAPVHSEPKAAVAPVASPVAEKLVSVEEKQASPASEAPVHATQVPLPKAAPVEVPSEPVAAAAPLANTAAVAERIKEIKRLVNEKVGNPVNLMDSHAEIGREYMNALLDAMKKSNGAQTGELQAAMTRLEAAFAQVQGIIATPVSEQKPAEPEQKEATPAPTPAPEPVPSRMPEVEEAAQPTPAVSEQRSVPLSATSEVPLRAKLTSVKENIAEAAFVPEKNTQVEPQAPKAPQDAQPAPSLHSVAKEKQLQELLRADKVREVQSKIQAQEIKNAVSDPLQTPEVTAGLNQLLSEWSLFKSSGIFGTGPNGKDHPLFKKLENLTMAAVIAGRFEGATPVIKQSITDYMNGWRYEEGIVHDHMETFEHYLRKVVAQILYRKKLG